MTRRRERLREGEAHARKALGLLDRATALLDEKLRRLREEGRENAAPIEDELEGTWPGPKPPGEGEEP